MCAWKAKSNVAKARTHHASMLSKQPIVAYALSIYVDMRYAPLITNKYSIYNGVWVYFLESLLFVCAWEDAAKSQRRSKRKRRKSKEMRKQKLYIQGSSRKKSKRNKRTTSNNEYNDNWMRVNWTLLLFFTHKQSHNTTTTNSWWWWWFYNDMLICISIYVCVVWWLRIFCAFSYQFFFHQNRFFECEFGCVIHI